MLLTLFLPISDWSPECFVILYVSLFVFNILVFRYAVVYHNTCVTNIPFFRSELLTHDQEEADTLIVLHAVDTATTDPFQELTICSPDTDVFLLLIYYHQALCNRTLFQTGRWKDECEINISDAYVTLGSARASALLGFHAFTGSDFTSKFKGKSKLSCWRQFLQANQEVLEAFSVLGQSAQVPNVATISNLETFVLNLYFPKRPQTVTDLSGLRWYLFSKYQWESDKLPPTASALSFKILRSHYVSLVWCQADRPIPDIPDAASYGWERDRWPHTNNDRFTT